jgi:hypothetical protein
MSDYLGRIGRMAAVETIIVPEERSGEAAHRQRAEGERLLAALKPEERVVVLDERGKALRELAVKAAEVRLVGARRGLLVGRAAELDVVVNVYEFAVEAFLEEARRIERNVAHVAEERALGGRVWFFNGFLELEDQRFFAGRAFGVATEEILRRHELVEQVDEVELDLGNCAQALALERAGHEFVEELLRLGYERKLGILRRHVLIISAI